MSATRKRAILVVPANNTTMEREIRAYCPELAQDLQIARVPRPPRPLTPDDLPMYRERTLATVDPLVRGTIDVVLYGCTSAGFLAGPQGDLEAVRALEARVGAPVVSTAVAMGAALHHSGLERVDLVSPYIAWKNRMLIAFLTAAGVSVEGCDSFEAKNPTELGAITAEMVCAKCLEVARPTSPAMLIACVQLPTIEAIPVLIERLRRPIWSAVRAAAWAALERLGLDAQRLVPRAAPMAHAPA